MKRKSSLRLVLGVLLVAVAGGAYYAFPAIQSGELKIGSLDLSALVSGQKKPAAASGAKAEARPTPVAVAKVTTRSVPVTIRTIGTIQARATVSVRSRVDGQILEAAFTEGQMVKRGDPLFTIDPRPFRAKLRQAEANLARDQALLEKAKADYERYQSLNDKGFSSQQKYEEARAAMNGLTATVLADQAAVDLAKLDLEYTTIRSPVTGRTGSILIHAGNLVKANDVQPLVVINETDPILASFAVPERHLTEIQSRLQAGTLAVEAAIPESNHPAVHGKLVFVNNAVDAQTGTIQLKASFDNADGALTPGQFVRIAIEMDAIHNARVVPERALQSGQDGSYVFVVKQDMTVEQRKVTPGPSVDGFVSLLDPIEVGTTVVTDGQLRLFKGAKVSFKPVDGGGAQPDTPKQPAAEKKSKTSDAGAISGSAERQRVAN